ncbi:MAG: hypothetical protein KDA58_05145 [Planctomycetaceae bacterium]|nr:hypothetical protein [Planctomycetaceae bacterium]
MNGLSRTNRTFQARGTWLLRAMLAAYMWIGGALALTAATALAQFPAPGITPQPTGEAVPTNGPVPQPPAPAVAEIVPRISAAEQSQVRQFLQQQAGGLLMSEGLMGRIVDRDQCDEGPIRDQILGADVFGTQTTKARAVFDFFPSRDQLQWYVHLRGTSKNCTTSFTPQAVIRGAGEYRFQLTKQMTFQGDAIATRSPAAFLETRQRNLQANTPVDGIPLVGPLVSMAAFMEAENRRPLAEQIAAQRLTREVAPRFNQEIDSQLVRLNQGLQLVRERWPQQLGPAPTLVTMSTDHFGLFALPASTTMGEAPAWQQLATAAGFSLVLHQTQATDLAAHLPLKGIQIQDTKLDELIETVSAVLGTVLNQPTPDQPPSTTPQVSLATLVLDSTLPLSFEFVDGEAIIELRAALRPTLGGEIPTQRIRFGIRSQLREEDALLTTRLVGIQSLNPETDSTAETLARQILQQQIEARLHPISLPRAVDLPEGMRTPELTRLQTSQLTAENGWLVWQVE